jgi:hypothetical protein
MSVDTTTPTLSGADRAAAFNLAQAEAAQARRAERAVARERELTERYPSILSFAAYGPGGPTRVEIACDDPQVRQGTPICEGTREIAVQDLFQVHRCEACQAYVTRKTRRAKQAARDADLRALARSLKA